jgi:nicotinate-nucleotide--dimethylbenzimidazole phosphoribosyltransferase
MSDLSWLDADVDFPDYYAEQQAPARRRRLGAPAGSLGQLDALGEWLCGVQAVCPPRDFTRARLVIFAGDHGIAELGVSSPPRQSTEQRVQHVLDGSSVATVLADLAGVGVRIEDVSVDSDALGRYKVRRSSGAIDSMDAMTPAEAQQGVQAGLEIANDEVDSGADLLIAGDLGRGSTTAAAAIISVLTESEPAKNIGRGSGIDDATWMRKAAAVRDARRRGWPYRDDPMQLLATVGGADIAALTGFLLGAASRRTPVLLDGVVVVAAAMVANQLHPRSVRWWQAGQQSSEPAHQLALRHLALKPILELGVGAGSGTGALMAVPDCGLPRGCSVSYPNYLTRTWTARQQLPTNRRPTNQLSTNRSATNRSATNRSAPNRLPTNRSATNRSATNPRPTTTSRATGRQLAQRTRDGTNGGLTTRTALVRPRTSRASSVPASTPAVASIKASPMP